jgi:hypothetical protein
LVGLSGAATSAEAAGARAVEHEDVASVGAGAATAVGDDFAAAARQVAMQTRDTLEAAKA